MIVSNQSYNCYNLLFHLIYVRIKFETIQTYYCINRAPMLLHAAHLDIHEII